MTSADRQSAGVMAWWIAISVISVANVVAWLWMARGVGEDGEAHDRGARRDRRWQVILAALFVSGCAFRSFLPRAEGQRICLYDSWLSNAVLSRSVATIAELALVAQWTLLLGQWARAARLPLAVAVSRLLLPFIVVAELCSWHTALTTNFIGSVIEESIWTVTSALVTVTLAVLWWRRREVRRPFIAAAIALNAAYLVFMCAVDVPMYAARVRADAASGKPFLSWTQGWVDATHRRVVTRRWEDWREEMPWMSLYFSAGVWISLSLVRAPRIQAPERPA